ncbi:MAG: hypothetical protein KGL59_14795 [Acidobacteriota bacterium]|nr:hypothetical protein [Acidobacteriota bacterium]
MSELQLRAILAAIIYAGSYPVWIMNPVYSSKDHAAACSVAADEILTASARVQTGQPKPGISVAEKTS